MNITQTLIININTEWVDYESALLHQPIQIVFEHSYETTIKRIIKDYLLENLLLNEFTNEEQKYFLQAGVKLLDNLFWVHIDETVDGEFEGYQYDISDFLHNITTNTIL